MGKFVGVTNTGFVGTGELSAVTSYMPCHIFGDQRLIGTGIRVGFYLLYAAAIIAVLFGVDKQFRFWHGAWGILTLSLFTTMLLNVVDYNLIIIDYAVLIQLVLWYPVYFVFTVLFRQALVVDGKNQSKADGEYQERLQQCRKGAVTQLDLTRARSYSEVLKAFALYAAAEEAEARPRRGASGPRPRSPTLRLTLARANRGSATAAQSEDVQIDGGAVTTTVAEARATEQEVALIASEELRIRRRTRAPKQSLRHFLLTTSYKDQLTAAVGLLIWSAFMFGTAALNWPLLHNGSKPGGACDAVPTVYFVLAPKKPFVDPGFTTFLRVWTVGVCIVAVLTTAMGIFILTVSVLGPAVVGLQPWRRGSNKKKSIEAGPGDHVHDPRASRGFSHKARGRHTQEILACLHHSETRSVQHRYRSRTTAPARFSLWNIPWAVVLAVLLVVTIVCSELTVVPLDFARPPLHETAEVLAFLIGLYSLVLTLLSVVGAFVAAFLRSRRRKNPGHGGDHKVHHEKENPPSLNEFTMIADASGGFLAYHEPDIISILTLISFFLFLAIAEWLADKIVRASLIGHIIVGLIYGVPIANILGLDWQATFLALGYIGLILIIFEGGLTIRLDLLCQNLMLSVIAALLGVLTPIALSFALLYAGFHDSPLEAFIVGTALCSTSLGTTFVVLSSASKSKPHPNPDLPSHDQVSAPAVDFSQTRIGTVLVSAAVLDDVCGLVLVSVIHNLRGIAGDDGGTGGTSLGWIIGRPVLASGLMALLTPAVVKFAAGPLYRRFVAPRLLRFAHVGHVFNILLMAVVLCAFLAIAAYAGASMLFGAFLAGAFVSGLLGSKARNVPEEAGVPAFVDSFEHYLSAPQKSSGRAWFTRCSWYLRSSLWGSWSLLGISFRPRIRKRNSEKIPVAATASWAPATLLGACMVARGEIGLLIIQIGLNETPFLTQKAFIIGVWAIVLNTIIGPVLVGILLKRTGTTIAEDARWGVQAKHGSDTETTTEAEPTGTSGGTSPTRRLA
ncbi:hypothetical protein CHGG_05163 [Chaetomium globosum CBS 148.51]|uniref:Cation/H+ exchanger transmembrane domain-containing protein n=1 Tax=Chaetomium globosum (strain ATCC 6205 / CBS 148.51 / DSM 1962 / NBRC 6347 / NRRL 1970) TaxID=306901 RepID=Q2GZ83_CHAGB|nr:uncharacterized protein CHGG_05163 [Chaetomium globosum CBS 148.51]EAQ88544.1 hypothetical protein CHGG_05163 [Chaetomium globosum CBS 148.51]